MPSKCPRCGGLLDYENDGYCNYLTCVMCNRRFDFLGNPYKLESLKRIRGENK